MNEIKIGEPIPKAVIGETSPAEPGTFESAIPTESLTPLEASKSLDRADLSMLPIKLATAAVLGGVVLATMPVTMMFAMALPAFPAHPVQDR